MMEVLVAQIVAAGIVAAAALALVFVTRRTMGRVIREVSEAQGRLDGMIRNEIARFRGEIGGGLRDQRVEVSGSLDRLLSHLSRSLEEMRQAESRQQEVLRGAVESRLDALRQENSRALEEVRKVVDDRLRTTLDQRLGESFARVGQQLEGVHRGLGEMTAMAAGLADVRRMLSNVKVRGTWGEVQLRTLLDEVLLPSQFECNVATRPGSSDRVEFAIRLPGGREDRPVRLPIDAKFPQEDFQRILRPRIGGIRKPWRWPRRPWKPASARWPGPSGRSTSLPPRPRTSRSSTCPSKASTPRS